MPFILGFTAFLLSIASVSRAETGHKRYPSLCKINHPSDSQIQWKCGRLKPGEVFEKRFGEHWKSVLRFNRVDRRHVYQGIFFKIPTDLTDLEAFLPLPVNYPPAKSESKFILIDLSEQFLGAYEFGQLVFSSPIASGDQESKTPRGDYRVTAADRNHSSSIYLVEGMPDPYPMHFALLFHVDRAGVSYWIHGRDLPGYPASHGCIGLYDELMQKEYYGFPRHPELDDARYLFDWAIDSDPNSENVIQLKKGPRVLIRD